MVKYYIFSEDTNINGVEFIAGQYKIQSICNKEFVMDGCFPIFQLDSQIAKDMGCVVNRLY